MKVAQAIWDFMQPISPLENADQMNALGRHLVKLCEDAHKFALLVRGCKDAYVCERPRRNQAVDLQEVEPQDSEKPISNLPQGDSIAFALFGALAKYPANSPGLRVVLEKAHVVIFQTGDTSET